MDGNTMIPAGTSYSVLGRGNRRVLDMRPRARPSPAQEDSFPWSKLRFGYAINSADSAKVDIKAGTIFKGKSPPLSVAATTVTIAALSYIYVQCDWNITLGTIGVQVALPVPDDDYFRRPLFQFDLSGGLASLSLICWMGGNIDLTTVYMANA
jgi:hypothetical protein